jgi:N utilization substance protein B
MARIASRSVRRLAFQGLFQLGAQAPEPDSAPAALRTWLQAEETLGQSSPEDLLRAQELACAAYAHRAAADAAIAALAPAWPTHRQAPVDRALLRLGHYELSAPAAHEKGAMIVSDIVDLAREFSTESSPSFVNALLDKVLRSARAATG